VHVTSARPGWANRRSHLTCDALGRARKHARGGKRRDRSGARPARFLKSGTQTAARERARDLYQALNATREAEQEERRRILRELFGAGGDSVWMQPPFFCDYGSNIELGERVFFNFNCIVLDVCPVRIGSFTLFGPGVQILTPMHPFNAELRRRQEFGKPVDIGSDVWVGGAALILPGVHIGSRSVIGAGCVVTRDVPEGVFAAGNPCRVIREITE